MLEELVVVVEDRPGIMAEIGEVLGNSGVNIETLCAFAHEGKGIVHLVADDGDEAGEALRANGFEIQGSHPVLTTTLDDRPGELGRYCRKLSSAGITISAVYVARREHGETELIFAVDDPETASEA